MIGLAGQAAVRCCHLTLSGGQSCLTVQRSGNAQGQGVPATLPDAPTAQLHQYVFFAHQATRRLKATRLDLLRQFDRIWPGAVLNLKRFRRAHPDLPCPIPIVETKPLERDTFRLLLEHCPNPYRVRELGEQGIIDLFHQHEQDCGPVTARRILTCAQG